MDKLDKEPWAEVKKEMVVEKGLSEQAADRLGVYVTSVALPPWEMLAQLQQDAVLAEHPGAKEAFADMGLLFKYLKAMDGLDKVSFDLSLARGLDYYTGVIYEAVLTDTDRVGSIAAGGRYDNLVGMFSSKKVPGTHAPCRWDEGGMRVDMMVRVIGQYQMHCWFVCQ